MTITKSELIERVAEKQDSLALKDVELAIKSILEVMAQSLAMGKRIEIRGFGSFSLHYRPPRTGRNPKSGAKVDLPGKYVPHFKPGKELRDRVNQAMQLEQSLSGGSFLEAGQGQPEQLRIAIRKELGIFDEGGTPKRSSNLEQAVDDSSNGGGDDGYSSSGEPLLATSGHVHRAADGGSRHSGYMS